MNDYSVRYGNESGRNASESAIEKCIAVTTTCQRHLTVLRLSISDYSIATLSQGRSAPIARRKDKYREANWLRKAVVSLMICITHWHSAIYKTAKKSRFCSKSITQLRLRPFFSPCLLQ